MNIYKIFQFINKGYEVYTSAVVVAEDAEQAQNMHPDDGRIFNPDVERKAMYAHQRFDYSWAYPEHVTVLYIGKACPTYTKPEVICSEYTGA